VERHTKITSLDMYTSLCSEDVVRADEFVDENAGLYPCYYYKKDAGLYISTSVVRLIKHKGSFNRNRKFKSGRWVLSDGVPENALSRVTGFVQAFFNRNQDMPNWYHTHETIDRDIFKVRPFETITFEKNEIAPFCRGDFISESDFIEKTAFYIHKFIEDIEVGYPDYNHVVLTGGKDSQLILLADKRDDARWNVFSSEPNAPLVKQWISDNAIPIQRFYEHDGRNEETENDLVNKIVAGDLFSNPRHLRWLPTLKEIGASLGGKCFFWAGTMGDALMSFNKTYHQGSLEHFRSIFFSRGISWQGNSLQTHKNFTGFSCLSPYQSKEIWDNVFSKYDYAALKKGVDFREKIGEVLAGRKVFWAGENPSPVFPFYDKNIDMNKEYVRCIRKALAEKRVHGRDEY
jgi:hypothetical protein